MTTALLAFVLVALTIFGIVSLARMGWRNGDQANDARAHLSLRWSAQADGGLPVGSLRVVNPGRTTVVASVQVRPATRWEAALRTPLTARASLTPRRPQVPAGLLLGTVEPGHAASWDVPLAGATPGRAVKLVIRLNRPAGRTRVLTRVLAIGYPEQPVTTSGSPVGADRY